MMDEQWLVSGEGSLRVGMGPCMLVVADWIHPDAMIIPQLAYSSNDGRDPHVEFFDCGALWEGDIYHLLEQGGLLPVGPLFDCRVYIGFVPTRTAQWRWSGWSVSPGPVRP